VAEERGLRVMQLEPIPLIIDALWTTRKYAEENPQVLNNVLRAYVRGIATLVREREKSMDIMRKYMRVTDTRVIQNAYDGYKKDVDRVPIPSDKAIQTTLEITHRLAPKLAGIDIKKHLYFGPVQRLKEEGFIDRLYK
jgi:ABC-type nitrate/sulfonate/bicarbonate transport system substrate-binding protein